jgi:hypothetical protein
MTLGLSLSAFTLLHVVISLVGIATGLFVLFGMIGGKRLDGSTLLFLVTTAVTSITGFMFPNEHITPGIVLGILSMIVLTLAVIARYALHLAGPWRAAYVVNAVTALYFNCFVLVAQSFAKVPFLKALAPTQSDPPFAIAQLVLLALFVFFGVRAVKGFPKQGTPALQAVAAGGR